MKTLWLCGVVGIGWVVALGGVRAHATQWTGGSGSAQPAGTWANSQPVLIGRGNGITGPPSQLAQFAQPGHSIVHGQPTTNRVGGGHGTFWRGPGQFHGHRHFIVVFVNGLPCWYPVYTGYPYGYDIPDDISNSGVSYASDDGYVPATAGGAADDSGVTQGAPDYGGLGMSWGQDLRREVATWGQFVGYVKAYVITAPAPAQADFREAFIGAYGLNGAAAYDKAAAEAAGIPAAPASEPKIITFPPPPPTSAN
ncbi:MAG TPA: hypothetical protein VMP11_03265 [Verrucomicrobiae bacterium]|nr:hypothetical protein [Verrucomicrobiae bacterium]